MHKIILRHRHTVVKYNLLYLCKLHWIDFLISLELFHEAGHVVGTITGINISLDNVSGHRNLCIERKFRILGMATETTSIRKDLINLLIQRQFRRRNPIDRPINYGHHSGCHQQHNCTKSYQFLHIVSNKRVHFPEQMGGNLFPTSTSADMQKQI